MLALGPELSAEVLKHVRAEDIERVATEMFNTKVIAPEVATTVLQEAKQRAASTTAEVAGGANTVRLLLTRALGGPKAAEILERLSPDGRGHAFDFVNKTDPAQLALFLKDEHPQTIALLLSHLKPRQAALILAQFDPELRANITARIALMEHTPPEVIREVETKLKEKLAALLNQDYAAPGGVEYLVSVLNQMNTDAAKSIRDALEVAYPQLAEEVTLKMFTFEDIPRLDDRSIQRVLREVDSKDLALALKGASEEVKARIFKNMSTRAGESLREELSVMGPVRLRQVKEAQQRIMQVIQRLVAAQEIIIPSGAEDELIV